MSMSQEQMAQLIRQDVIDSINQYGVQKTAAEYGVKYDQRDAVRFIDDCVAAEMSRAYA